MTYNEKKSLYESIMKDVAKLVKHTLDELNINESGNRQFDNRIKDIYNYIQFDDDNEVKLLLDKWKNDYDITKPVTRFELVKILRDIAALIQ